MSYSPKSVAKALAGDLVAGLVVDEDGIGLVDTVDHLRRVGLTKIAVLSRQSDPPDIPDCPVFTRPDGPLEVVLTALIRALHGQWLHLCFNAEFLAFPFSETRSLQDFCGFLKDERRRHAHLMIVDHYAGDLSNSLSGYAFDDPWFDASGYYARHSETQTDPKEPLVDIFGGLRWRFEEEFPADRRHANRAGLFICRDDLTLTPDLQFTDPHMNTLQAPWHHSPRAALRSFRSAKYLMVNPGSRDRIDTFKWPQSQKCDWTSQQLMELGFIEPGQWF